MLPSGERYRPAWRDLEPGEPWTFITSETICLGTSGAAARVGDIIEWYPDGDEPILFRVDAIEPAPGGADLLAYSCTHVAQSTAFRGQMA